jgi:quercetin dioxygenase-like cupin family protein
MSFARSVSVSLLVLAIFAVTTQLLLAQQSDKPLYVASVTSKFTNFPGVPQCMTGAAQEGDPSKGNAVLLLKAQTGCMLPWHWHTPSEQLMMVSGRAKAEMKDSGPVILRAGDYLNLTSRHVHQFTCLASCVLFDVTGAAPFDVHYVDAIGNEIPSEQALKAAPKPATKMAKPQKQE